MTAVARVLLEHGRQALADFATVVALMPDEQERALLIDFGYAMFAPLAVDEIEREWEQL